MSLAFIIDSSSTISTEDDIPDSSLSEFSESIGTEATTYDEDDSVFLLVMINFVRVDHFAGKLAIKSKRRYRWTIPKMSF